MDNYVYPSDEEVIDIESVEPESNSEPGNDSNDQTSQKTKTIRVKKKADEDTIKESYRIKERVSQNGKHADLVYYGRPLPLQKLCQIGPSIVLLNQIEKIVLRFFTTGVCL